MDGARLSRFPHLSWLAFDVAGGPSADPLTVDLQGVCHVISLTARGGHDVRWIVRGRERRWEESAGAIHFLPADDAHHTFLTRMSADCLSRVLLLPRRHLADFARSEGCGPLREPRRFLLNHDSTLQAAIDRLSVTARLGRDTDDGPADEAARRLVLRIVELFGGGTPDWADDTSVFGRKALGTLVEYIDAHLRETITAEDLATRVGMSPSHFARKFRQSTGLSLYRFVNRRRIVMSLARLKGDGVPLADLSVRLGFSSQSHFTRLFSALTGMTPAKYRKRFRPTIG